MAATIATRTMTTEAVTKPAVKRGWRMIWRDSIAPVFSMLNRSVPAVRKLPSGWYHNRTS
jgi:hypothetical protein